MAKAKETKEVKPNDSVEEVIQNPELSAQENNEVKEEDPVGTIVSRLNYSVQIGFNGKPVTIFPHARISGVKKSSVTGLTKGVKFIISK